MHGVHRLAVECARSGLSVATERLAAGRGDISGTGGDVPALRNRDRQVAARRGSILVTGGAGYIGSHVVKQLIEANEQVVVLDNLGNAYREAAGTAEFHEGDVHDRSLLEFLFRTREIESIMHFAASTRVAESVANPGKYYRNNTAGTLNLLIAAVESGARSIVFSSSAAVYGVPEGGVCREDSPAFPVNPYGRSKLMSEVMIRDICGAADMRHVILRYFNVAGAATDGRLGQRGRWSSHLIKRACEVAVGKRDTLEIFGTDYPTADGTCIRDYIHVEDLAAAHVRALSYLRSGGESVTLNCGYGKGFSVREVIRAVERAAGRSLRIRESDRRDGDPPILIAAADRIHEVLEWAARFSDLDVIVKTALAWEHRSSVPTRPEPVA